MAEKRPHQAVLADLCQKLVMETYAPAGVLINRNNECLYSLGPTDHYLRVAPGHPTSDLLAMARDDVRTKLRSAIQRATKEKKPITVGRGHINEEGNTRSFHIHVQPVQQDGEELLWVCFIDEPTPSAKKDISIKLPDFQWVTGLEQELEITKAELQSTIHSLEAANEEQTAVNEEALSVNEEYISANEEYISANEELAASKQVLVTVNARLQEALERQQLTSDALQNVLYSTDVATLFLDTDLKVRFFTPATKLLFSLISSDVGRPLADLNSLSGDRNLLADAATVLENLTPLECEIEGRRDIWFVRRIVPYRTQNNGVEGIVITFADITERKRTRDELIAAKRQAELATVAKSRFLAAASHDLRQPLQTLALLQGLLAKKVIGDKAHKLVERFGETLTSMSGMLNALLDINQIEAGTVQADMTSFPVNDLFDRLRDEYTYHAQSQGLVLQVVPCSLIINSDPRLLEQMIRNLLSNALKYTEHGKVLLGCRHHEGMLSIEIWDTGVGIPNAELQAIFEEYHQLDNAARERSRGLGLGLSIVHRLGNLLNYRVRVHSRLGKGSVFAIEVILAPDNKPLQAEQHRQGRKDYALPVGNHRSGTILVIEDDTEMRELLDLFLKDQGHHVTTAEDGIAALELVASGNLRPGLVLTDYNMPNGMDGLQVASRLRQKIHPELPIIILTGDISTDTLREIAQQNCLQLNKPVKLNELTEVIQRLLPISKTAALPEVPLEVEVANQTQPAVIYVVDDDSHIRDAIRTVLEDEGMTVRDYETCEAFLDAYRPGGEACLLIDAYLPGMNGIELLEWLKEAGHKLPAIMITGKSDVSMAVHAMKAGALDFIEKPVSRDDLLVIIERALEQSRDTGKLSAWRESAANHMASLTARQRQIMTLILAGHPNKNIAADLGISQRTVESHRATIMKKTGSKSLPALARLALAAA
jgi:two-component system CheB/CheR fusion protein